MGCTVFEQNPGLCRADRHSLSHVALGCGVEGGELHSVAVLRPHLVQNLLEGVELAALRVDVILVDLRERRDCLQKHTQRRTAQRVHEANLA